MSTRAILPETTEESNEASVQMTGDEGRLEDLPHTPMDTGTPGQSAAQMSTGIFTENEVCHNTGPRC